MEGWGFFNMILTEYCKQVEEAMDSALELLNELDRQPKYVTPPYLGTLRS